MVQHQGWGTSTEHRCPELQRGQFLYAVFTDGKGAVWHAGLYDFHAGQGKGAERIEGGTLLPGGLLELQHQGQEREEDYHGPVPPSQQGGAGELQGDPLYEDLQRLQCESDQSEGSEAGTVRTAGKPVQVTGLEG